MDQRLHDAALAGNAAAITALLADGADIRAKDWRGWTAFHYAGASDHVAAIEALVAAGANIHAKEENGWTALHWAGARGHVAAIAALLAADADMTIRGNAGETACDLAVRFGWHAAVELLKKAEAEERAAAADLFRGAEDASYAVVSLAEGEEGEVRPHDPPCQEEPVAEELQEREGARDAPGQGGDFDEASGQGEGAIDTTHRGEQVGGAPGQGEKVDPMPRQTKDANHIRRRVENAGAVPDSVEGTIVTPDHDGHYPSVAGTEAKVRMWLSGFLPDLRREDAVNYRKRLIDDGFDSDDTLRFVREEDLGFMKVGHRRTLMMKRRRF